MVIGMAIGSLMRVRSDSVGDELVIIRDISRIFLGVGIFSDVSLNILSIPGYFVINRRNILSGWVFSDKSWNIRIFNESLVHGSVIRAWSSVKF